jgi:hypothetical protein
MALPELNTARYKMVIPSTGETVSYRPYLVKEEKILMMAMESDNNKVIMQATIDVIKSCLEDDIDVENLPMFDIESIFLALRAKSVGETIDVKVKCEDEQCEIVNDLNINFEDIEIPTVTLESTRIELTDDVGVVMKYPSMKDVERIGDLDESDAEGALSMIMSCIDAVYDADDLYPAENESKKSLTNFIDSLSSVQFMKLSDFFREMPTIEHTLEYKCGCGRDETQVLRGLPSFFT